MDVKKSLLIRPAWRIHAEPPPETQVDFDPTAPPGPVLDPAPVVDWRSSSYDLLNGVEIRDHSDSIPGELFERLFKR